MKIQISLSKERYYDHDDLIFEDKNNIFQYIQRFINCEELKEIVNDAQRFVGERLHYFCQQLYKILYMVVKRNNIYSRETLEDKVREKVNAYKEAHQVGDKYINVFIVFRAMFHRYAELACELAGINYSKFPHAIQETIEHNLCSQIGVMG